MRSNKQNVIYSNFESIGTCHKSLLSVFRWASLSFNYYSKSVGIAFKSISDICQLKFWPILLCKHPSTDKDWWVFLSPRLTSNHAKASQWECDWVIEMATQALGLSSFTNMRLLSVNNT
jgi:hypothetical protein